MFMLGKLRAITAPYFIGNQQINTAAKYLLCKGDAKKRFYKIHEAKVVEWWDDCELVEITGYK